MKGRLPQPQIPGGLGADERVTAVCLVGFLFLPCVRL